MKTIKELTAYLQSLKEYKLNKKLTNFKLQEVYYDFMYGNIIPHSVDYNLKYAISQFSTSTLVHLIDLELKEHYNLILESFLQEELIAEK